MDEDDQQKLFKIIGEHTNRAISEINNNDRFNADYGLDSIDAVGLLHAINIKFKIKINEQEAAKIETVTDMKNCIDKHLEP